jgi:hypothetical protein
MNIFSFTFDQIKYYIITFPDQFSMWRTKNKVNIIKSRFRKEDLRLSSTRARQVHIFWTRNRTQFIKFFWNRTWTGLIKVFGPGTGTGPGPGPDKSKILGPDPIGSRSGSTRRALSSTQDD